MFDVGFDELLMIAVIAIVVIGPKDLPMALRTAGRWIGKVRRVSNHFRSGIESMIREAELEDMEKKWREQNAAIMTAFPGSTADTDAQAAAIAAAGVTPALSASESPETAAPAEPAAKANATEPELPLGPKV